MGRIKFYAAVVVAVFFVFLVSTLLIRVLSVDRRRKAKKEKKEKVKKQPQKPSQTLPSTSKHLVACLQENIDLYLILFAVLYFF